MKNAIWVLEDDESINEVIKIILTEAGYLTKVFTSFEKFEAAFANSQPNLILMDIILSGQSGAEITRKIKADKLTKHIPIILMSASTDLKKLAKEVEADAYLCKPFNIEELETAVLKQLSSIHKPK